jgi:hypothetical protein
MEEVTKSATMLNSVVSDWPTYFAIAFNKGRIQRVTVENTKNIINMKTGIKIKRALTSWLEKEKAVESQLSQKEQEWKKEGKKV